MILGGRPDKATPTLTKQQFASCSSANLSPKPNICRDKLQRPLLPEIDSGKSLELQATYFKHECWPLTSA